MRDNAQYQAQLTTRRTEYDYDELPTGITRNWSDIHYAELHHTGDRGPVSLSFEHKRRWILAIERFHELGKGWTDIFYHVFVFADGEVWAGRMPLRSSQANLHQVITLHLPGNNPVPTEAQIRSIERLLIEWELQEVWDHQTRPAATFCAGPNVRAIIPRLNETIQKGTTTMPIPESVNDDFIYAHDKGIVTPGDNPYGVMNDPEELIPAWRAAVMAARAMQGAIAESVDQERLDEMGEQLDSMAQAIQALAKIVDDFDFTEDKVVGRVTADVLSQVNDTEITLEQTARLTL